MKNLIITFLLFTGITVPTLAQFGPPKPSGDGNGRPSRPDATSELNLEGNRPRGNSKISGYVIDSAATAAVEFATVAMIDADTKKVLDGTMADDKGGFEFTRVAPGKYDFKVTFIGYADRTIPNVTVKKGEDVNLGVIKLSVNAQMLKEVEVTGVKSLIEEKVDRIVYNAENDVTTKGGDGADVLRKVPMLNVDIEGNVSLRGNSNIKVLINNKPSTIVASSVADALKMIPADLIKSVEVITSPSAKYDAEGSSGIINIITKKATVQGYSLSLNTGVGLRGSNLGLNGNLKVGKWGFTLGGFGRGFYNKADTELQQSTLSSLGTTRTEQSSKAKDLGAFGRYNLGVNYDISKNEYLTGTVAFGTRNFVRDQDLISEEYFNNNWSSSENRQVKTKDLSNNVDVNLDYVKTFKPSQEWSVSGQYSQNNLTNNFNALIDGLEEEKFNQQKNINGNVNREITLQTDYTTPVNENQLLEVGLKRIMRTVNSDYSYLVGKNDVFQPDSRRPSGELDYNQNISAGYVSYMYSTKNKLNIKAGVRYEYTTIAAVDNDETLNLKPYGNVVPSINISKTIKETTIKLAYNNRIQRPGLQELNPNFNAANPQNITIGNPNLQPEVSNNVELSFSKSIKRNYINASFFARQTNNAILQISTPSDTLFGSIITTYQNVGEQKAAGVNLFGNFFITQKWSLNGGVDIFYNYLSGQVRTLEGFTDTSNDGISVNGRIMSQLALNKGWGLQAFGGYRGNTVLLQGTRTGTPMYSIGVKKDFNDKKGSFGLSVDNIFGGMQFRTETNSQIFTQRSVNYIYNQNIRATFSYKFGNMKFMEEKKSRVKNTDVKSSGDGNGQQGGQMN